MARKPRLEFSDAIYHILSRGNYRKEIFDDRAAGAFETALFEACGKCGWRLHAYVIMRNHYHLALQTPEPNLVEGMKWLQGAFGNRFNAFRREHGHVFQSRYKSLVIEPGRSLLGLVNYIHLNPVRAGIIPLEDLRKYPRSSLPKFFEQELPPHLVRREFLAALEFPNSPAGMKQYVRHLRWCEEGDASRRDELARRYCRGWAVAGEKYRQDIGRRFEELETPVEAPGKDYADLRESKWEGLLRESLKAEGKSLRDAAREPKAAAWKVRAAAALRSQTTATNQWIANRLAMGHPSRVRNLIRDGRL